MGVPLLLSDKNGGQQRRHKVWCGLQTTVDAQYLHILGVCALVSVCAPISGQGLNLKPPPFLHYMTNYIKESRNFRNFIWREKRSCDRYSFSVQLIASHTSASYELHTLIVQAAGYHSVLKW